MAYNLELLTEELEYIPKTTRPSPNYSHKEVSKVHGGPKIKAKFFSDALNDSFFREPPPKIPRIERKNRKSMDFQEISGEVTEKRSAKITGFKASTPRHCEMELKSPKFINFMTPERSSLNETSEPNENFASVTPRNGDMDLKLPLMNIIPPKKLALKQTHQKPNENFGSVTPRHGNIGLKSPFMNSATPKRSALNANSMQTPLKTHENFGSLTPRHSNIGLKSPFMNNATPKRSALNANLMQTPQKPHEDFGFANRKHCDMDLKSPLMKSANPKMSALNVDLMQSPQNPNEDFGSAKPERFDFDLKSPKFRNPATSVAPQKSNENLFFPAARHSEMDLKFKPRFPPSTTSTNSNKKRSENFNINRSENSNINRFSVELFANQSMETSMDYLPNERRHPNSDFMSMRQKSDTNLIFREPNSLKESMAYPQNSSIFGNNQRSQQFWTQNPGRKMNEEIDQSEYSKTPLKLQRNGSFNLKYYDEDVKESINNQRKSSAFPHDISISSKEAGWTNYFASNEKALNSSKISKTPKTTFCLSSPGNFSSPLNSTRSVRKIQISNNETRERKLTSETLRTDQNSTYDKFSTLPDQFVEKNGDRQKSSKSSKNVVSSLFKRFW